MGLFSHSEKRAARTATNAPRHWPNITVEHWVPNTAYHYLSICATFTEQLVPAGAQLRFADQRLYDDGVLNVPLVVTEGDQNTAIFVYPTVDEKAAAHFCGARSVLRQRDGWNAVYYAPEAIQPVKPATVVEPLDTPHFRRAEKDRPAAEYAMWWPTPEDPEAASSPALALLYRWFRATEGYASLLFSSFIRVLELADKQEEMRLFALPEQAIMVPLEGPGRLSLYLHASQQEGLWLAFDTRTAASDRTRLLALMVSLAERFRDEAARQNVPPLEAEQGSAAWWHQTHEEALRKSAEDRDGLRVGWICEDGSVRRLKPGATTHAERQSDHKHTNLAPELVTFATSAADMAVDMMSSNDRTADQKLPAPGEEAPPSFDAFAIVHAGNDTYTRVFWDADPSEAAPLAEEMIRSIDDVRFAALVVDTFVRTADDRCDAVLVRAQAAGDERSIQLVQRYRPRRKGQPFARLGNVAITGHEAPLITPSAETGDVAPPSEEVMAFAKETLDSTVRIVTIKDPSGAASVQGTNGPITRPFLNAMNGDKGLHIAFALMTFGKALAACPKLTQKEASISLAAFVYDEIVLKNDEPIRHLHFVVQERHSSTAFHFVQRYAAPTDGRPFELIGALTLRGLGPSLFPAVVSH